MARRFMAVPVAGVALALVGAALGPTTASAAYPPGGYPGPAPAGGFPTVVVSETVSPGGGSLSAADGAAQLALTIPSGAFSQSTQVTIYGGADSVLGSLLPSGEHLVLAYAVGWDPSSSPLSPLTLTIGDTAIPSDAIVYYATATGIAPATGSTVTAGSITVSFSADPGILVAAPGTSSPPPLPFTGAAEGASGGGPPLLALVGMVIGVLAIVWGVVGWRRRGVADGR
jgi:hypothetical protein